MPGAVDEPAFRTGNTGLDAAQLLESAELVVAALQRQHGTRHAGELGGDGGIIAVDKDGNIILAFNEGANGMFRGSWREGEEPDIGIFDDD